jgi:predicted GH43/DUF377 family glycosyl hydrolase
MGEIRYPAIMNWQKKGQVYSPSDKIWWQHKYGMMPTPFFIEDKNIIRVYFGVTDDKLNGRTTFMDLNADDPSIVVRNADRIVLDMGSAGMFDDSGAVPSCVLNTSNGQYLYYVGFQRCEKVPYMLFSGLAIANDGESFIRRSFGPLIDRSEHNFISNAAPFVIRDEGKFKMWFWVGKEWTEVNNKKYIKAEISYAESGDGITWKQFNTSCISLDPENEFSVGRPWVLKEAGKYRMWYSVRHKDKLYRLGYAESRDGITWERMDKYVGIDVSESGWDCEMICYPAVIKVKQKTFLFYNGNNNGATGFGYAELIEA